MVIPKSSKKIFLLPTSELKRPVNVQFLYLCVIFFSILCFGMTNLYSASIGTNYFWHQLRNLSVIIPAFVICGWVIPIRKINDYGYWIYYLTCFLLFIVLLLGKIAGGAQRWISFGPISFQPSELAKLAVAIVVARFFASHRSKKAYKIRDLLPLMLIVGVVFGLIFAQPDFGTAGVCLLIALTQIAFMRIDYRAILIVLVSSPIFLAVGWTLLRPYQKLRILNLLNPNLDPQNSGYNSIQSLIAIGSGGLFGKGYMQGTQAHLKFLPERHTDFIFSVFAEEHGFWGCCFIFALFGALTFIILDIAKNTRDTFSGLLAIGIGALIFLEFVINIAMVLGMFPVVGLPLPFFSYGSSLLLTVCIGLGLLVSINRSSTRGSGQ